MRYVFDDCILDTERHALLRQAQPVRLQPRVFRMLAYLLEHHQRVVPRQELFEQVWQGEYVSKATLDGCIKQVRQAIGDSGRMQRLLKTQHGVGYQLVAPVSVQDAAESEPDMSGQLPSSDHVVSPPSVSPPHLAERRQLTVLSGALADAPYLFGHLDTDDLHRVLRAFHSLCADTISPFGGTVAQRVDDHCVIYFGYPQAHGDDARHAVLAALHLLKAIRSGLSTLTPWLEGTGGIKVGIHTGEVVVDSDGDGSGALVLGSVATLASVLREVAEPQTVVISADTASLVDGYFTCQSLAPVALPRQRDAMPMYRVTGASGAQMRLDLVPARGLTPFVGREPELSLLTARWGQAREGRGQAVLISGEAGIGKSRLLRTVAEQLVEGDAIEGRGSPYHQQSAFYALTDVLRHLLQLNAHSGGDPVGQCEDVLHQYGLGAARHLPFIAPLLNLSLPSERYPDSPLSPQQKRQCTFESLLALVLGASKPLLLILEDLHWVDPSTLEWVEMLLDQLPTAEVLLLMTCRPEFAVTWASRSYLTQVTLDRLGTLHSRRMVESIVQNRALPPPLIEQIIAHSDGVPLFIEELSRTVIDTGETRIPMTLQDTLTARLDQVGMAKRTVQLGAVLGRQFSAILLRAVSPLGEDDLRQDLRALIDSELLYQWGLGEEATYQFKHALVQDAAYGSLLRRNRQQLHRKIAQVLETRCPLTKDTRPELLAQHYTQAGLTEQAVAWWLRAGNSAIEQSAYAEGIAYLSRALALLDVLPDTLSHRHTELDIQITLGSAFHWTKGRNSPEVLQAGMRARELCDQTRNTSKLIQVLHRLRIFHTQSGDLPKALELAEEIARLAQQSQDPGDQIKSDFSLGVVLLNMGALRDAQAHFARGAALGERLRLGAPGSSHAIQVLYCRGSNLLALSVLGYMDQAREQAHETLRQAQERNHPFALASTLICAAKVYLFCRDASAVAELAAWQMALCREYGLATEPEGMALHGWALVQQGEQARGLVQIQQVLDVESKMNQLLHLMLFADACRMTGKIEEGMQTLARARELVEQTQIRWHEAELYRLRGELLLAQSPDNDMAAESCLHHAFGIARQQQAKAWELRAVTSMSRLWQSQGKGQEAYKSLAPVYGWFTEGFDTADLKDARALLDKLAG